MAGKGDAAKGGKGDDKNTDDEANKAEESKTAAEKDEGKTDDDAGKQDPPAKKEKTYTKAELDALNAKAVADAKKKWDDEKDLTELERVKKENEDLRAANRLRDAKDSVTEALTKAGARSSELLWKTLAGDLEFDDKGNLKNLDALVTGLKTDYPDQFGEAKPDETIDGGAGQGGKGGTKLTKEAIEKMTPTEINENWEEVSKVLAAAK